MNKGIRITRDQAIRIGLVAIAVLMVPALAHAQTGCADSPENPTAVLALVGSAGAGIAYLRNKHRARKIK